MLQNEIKIRLKCKIQLLFCFKGLKKYKNSIKYKKRRIGETYEEKMGVL